jgi:hypothetical protein
MIAVAVAVILRRDQPLLGIPPQPPRSWRSTSSTSGDSSHEDKVGEMTSTGLSGFNTAGELVFTGETAFGNRTVPSSHLRHHLLDGNENFVTDDNKT